MNLSEVFEQYAARIGKDELTRAEKQQAYLNAILEGKKIESFVFIQGGTQGGKETLVRNLEEAMRRIGEQEEDTLRSVF